MGYFTTHTHCDPIGGNKAIRDKTGCDVALHRIGALLSALTTIGLLLVV